jgi:F-type H+-transporting ATPase subunit gamma
LRVVQRFENRVGKPVKYIAVGRKGRDTLIRTGREVVAEFSDIPADPTIADISPIAKIATDAYLSGEVDEVLIAYTDFINMLTQSPVVLGWLPLTPHSTAEQAASEYVKAVPAVSEGTLIYDYEPSAEGVLAEIVPRFTELQLYQAILESQASEHAARMNAMRNATDNASQLVEDLTLEYNKARQAGITNEILDIVGGASALEASLKAKATAKSASKAQAVINAMTSGVGEYSRKNGKKQTAKPEVRASSATATTSDDLTQIDGIGAKTAEALQAQLAAPPL